MMSTARAHDVFEGMLERVRLWYGFYVCGDVVMPEHVHLLISEPERGLLSLALQMLRRMSRANCDCLRAYRRKSQWTPRKRERIGIAPVIRQGQSQRPRPVSPKNGETRTGRPQS